MTLALPIDALLPEIVRRVREERALVVQAAPGAGKTTRVPRALLQAGLAGRGEILVLEPRRLPTRMAATFVARELDEPLGEQVGYTVRFEDVGSPRTKLRFVTEGILVRRLAAEPTLPGVQVVVLDELHERHLQTDLALALLTRLRRTSRPDLALVAMSATLQGQPIAEYLQCGTVASEGRLFPLRIEHQERPDDRPLEVQVSAAVKRLVLEEPAGDVLVFLPGAAEIRRALEQLAPFAQDRGLRLLPLHGELPPGEQDAAVRPGPQRKIILSTNVAESSVTIEGVTAVVDAGLARVAGHSPWTGLPTLGLEKISQASAIQRAGRAGRTAPGRVFRLYTKQDFDGRPQRETPELLRADLCESALLVRSLGIPGLDALEWLEAPPATAVQSAEALLTRLGATAPGGALSELGRRMAKLPLHPRLARLVCEGEARGVGKEAAALAAIVSERDLRRSTRVSLQGPRRAASGLRAGSSDLLELAELLREAEGLRLAPHRLRELGLDVRATEAASRAKGQLCRLVRDRAARPKDPEEALLRATLAAFPDRIGKLRSKGRRDVVFAEGGAGELGEESVLHDASFLVAVDAGERPGARGGRTIVRLASAIEADWILQDFPDAVEATEELVFRDEQGRVDRIERLAFGQLALEEESRPAPPSPEAAKLLARAALARGIIRPDGLVTLRARLGLLCRCFPELALPAVDEAHLPELVAALCEGRTRLSELEGLDPAVELERALPQETQRLLREQAPLRISLPGGRGCEVHYPPDAPPWCESRLQDFFGMAKTPSLAGGRAPLTVHLNAPNGRAVQVTQDLAGFWARHYPTIRKELMRKYPRHLWPEDGADAKPPPPNRIR